MKNKKKHWTDNFPHYPDNYRDHRTFIYRLTKAKEREASHPTKHNIEKDQCKRNRTQKAITMAKKHRINEPNLGTQNKPGEITNKIKSIAKTNGIRVSCSA